MRKTILLICMGLVLFVAIFVWVAEDLSGRFKCLMSRVDNFLEQVTKKIVELMQGEIGNEKVS